jgi:hypothetical protein
VGVSEVNCIIFEENNDNPYEINNSYIKLSIVFHPVIHSGRLMHGSSFSQGRNMGIPSWARFLKRKQG